MELFCRSYGDLLCIFLYGSIFLDVDIRHLGISMELGSWESFFLDVTSMFDFFSNHFGCVVFILFSEFSCLDARYLYKEIDAIKDRSWETRSVFFYSMGTTDTLLFWIPHESTRTGVHSPNERESRWIPTGHIDSINRDFSIFEWLTKCFEDMFVEFEKFIEKEDSFMGEWYFSWFGVTTSSDDRCFTCCMVDDTKWSLCYEWHLLREESCNGVYSRKLYLFFTLHRWEYPCESLCEHSLSWPWWSLHEDIVSSCGCDQECSFCLFLAMDTREIDRHVSTRNILYIEMWTRYDRSFPQEHLDSFRESWYSNDIDIRDNWCFSYIRDRKKYPLHAHLASENCRWKCSLDASDIPIKGELPEKEWIGKNRRIEFKIFSENPERNREIVYRSFFFKVCWCEIHRDTAPSREAISTIFYSTPNSFTTLLYSGISESHYHELTYSHHNIDLDFYDVSLDSIDRSRK